MDVIIIGAGGHGRDCHQIMDDLHADGSASDLHLIGYVDDNPDLAGQEVQGLPVLGGLEWLSGRNVACVMGIGYPRPRYAAQQRASALGKRAFGSPARSISFASVEPKDQVGCAPKTPVG